MAKKTGTGDGLYKRGNVWWVRTDPITRRQASTGCTDKASAIAWRERRRILAGDRVYASAEEASRRERLIDWIGVFLERREVQGKSSATLEYERQKLGHFCRVLGNVPDSIEVAKLERALGSVVLYDLQPASIDRYVAVRRREGVTDHTLTKELGVLRRVLRMAARAGAYPFDPDLLKPEDLTAGYVPRDRAPTLGEVERVLAELRSEQLRLIVRLAVGLGVRLSEACALTRQHFDLEQRIVHVPGTKTRGARRTVPILDQYAGLVLECYERLPIGARPNNLYRDITAACKRAGVERFTPNDLRRAHLSILAEQGVSADDLRRLAGHTSSSRTLERVYERPRAVALAERINRQVDCNGSVTLPTGPQRSPAVSSGARVRVYSRKQLIPGAALEIRTPDLRFTKPRIWRAVATTATASMDRGSPDCSELVTLDSADAWRAVPELYAGGAAC